MQAKPGVDPSTFFDLDIRVGRVVDVRQHGKARKPAYVLDVDLGALGTRTTSAQLTNYRPEQLRGRLVVCVANIGARRVAGVRSELLVLGAYTGDGSVALLSVDQTEPVDDPAPRPGDAVG